MKLKRDTLHYTERTEGKYRDLRQLEVKFLMPKWLNWLLHTLRLSKPTVSFSRQNRHRFARVSINGIHRNSKSAILASKHANPGWVIGTENVTMEWTKYYRHCWHFSLEAYKRGITFSYGKCLF